MRAAAHAKKGGVTSALRPALTLGALGGVLAFGALSLMAPRYVAETRLTLQSKGRAAERLAPETLQRQSRAAAGPDVAAAVAADLKLAEKVEFNRSLGFPDTWTRLLALSGLAGPAPAGDEKEQVRAAVQRHIDVAPLADMGQLAIRFRATDPALAASGANAAAAAYIRTLKAAAPQAAAPQSVPEPAPAAVPSEPAAAPGNTKMADAAVRARELAERVTALSAEVAAYETELSRLTAAEAIRVKPQAAADPRAAEMSAELARARAARLEADTALKATREAVKSNNLDAIADLQRSPSMLTLLQERARLERQITELSATLLPEHPRMQQLNTKLAGLKREIAVALGKSVEKLERDAKAAAAREEALKKTLDEIVTQPAPGGAQNDTKIKQVDAALKERRAELERSKAELAEAERLSSTAAVSAPKPAEAAPKAAAAAAAPVPPAATASAGDNAIEALIVKPAEAVGLAPIPDKQKLSLLAAGMSAVLGLLLGLFKSAVAARRTSPDLADAADDDADATLEAEPVAPQAAATAVVASPARPKSAASALAAAVSAKLGRKRSEPPVVPAEPRAAGSDTDYFALEGEALGSADQLDDIAAAILARPVQEIGIRTLVTGDNDALQPIGEALGLARRLAASGKGVVLVDWCTEGNGLAHELAIRSEPGMNELLLGRASFEDIVQCLAEVNGSELHVIPAGNDLSGQTDALDPDVVNLVLDALDEAYEHIVVVGRHAEASELFEAILGRFDVGVVVQEAASDIPPPGTFLGFEVTDIEILSCVRQDAGMIETPAPVAPVAPPAPAAPVVSEPPSSVRSAAPPGMKATAAASSVASAMKAFTKSKKPAVEEKPVATVSQAAIARALRTTGNRGAAPA